MHRDTVMRSWGPLLCHSSTTITSCCSMIMHGPMLQGSVHNSWKLKTSVFLHGQHTHRTCHPCLGPSGSAYTTACSCSCQYPATSHSHWRGVDKHYTGHNQQPDQLYVKEMCCTAWGKWWSRQILTGFRTPIWLFWCIDATIALKNFLYKFHVNKLNSMYYSNWFVMSYAIFGLFHQVQCKMHTSDTGYF